MWPYSRWPLTQNLLGLHHLFLPHEHVLKQAVKFLFALFAIISWRSLANYQRTNQHYVMV